MSVVMAGLNAQPEGVAQPQLRSGTAPGDGLIYRSMIRRRAEIHESSCLHRPKDEFQFRIETCALIEMAQHSGWARWSAIAALLVSLATLVGPSAGATVTIDAAAGPKSLVILGASYARSWGTPPLPGYRVTNRGVGGEQTAAMRLRFQRDVVAANADTVLIWGHVNNITQSDVVNSTPDRMEAVKQAAREDYLTMLRQSRAAGIEVILATEVPLAESVGILDEARVLLGRLRGKPSYAARVNIHVRDLNAFVRQLAAREGLRLLDFELVFAPDGGGRKSEYATEDHSHITADGYRALTGYAVAEIIKER